MSIHKLIDVFLTKNRFALVGVSANPRDFSRVLMRDFVKRGYDPIPVNPNQAEIEGQPAYRKVQEIAPKPEAALIMTGPEIAKDILNDCRETGISLVWLYRGLGTGALSRAALDYCRENNIDVIPGYCPYMFFPDTGFVHRLHGFFMKLRGRYPE